MEPTRRDAPPKRRSIWWLIGCVVPLLICLVPLGFVIAEVLRLVGQDAEAKGMSQILESHFQKQGPVFKDVHCGGVSVAGWGGAPATPTERLWNRWYPAASGKVKSEQELDLVRQEIRRVCAAQGYDPDQVLNHVQIEAK